MSFRITHVTKFATAKLVPKGSGFHGAFEIMGAIRAMHFVKYLQLLIYEIIRDLIGCSYKRGASNLFLMSLNISNDILVIG